MAERVELELKIKGGNKAVKTLGQLEKELEKAREEIKGVEVGSKAFNTLATQIQKASSEVKTLEKQMEGLEPQQKAEAFLKLGEGIAGGFAVAQGSMALLGIESENLEKLQVGVQSAIAIAMGVRMMAEAALMYGTAKRVAVEKLGNIASKASAVWAYGVATAHGVWATVQGVLTGSIGATTIALGVLKAAVIATGIGALVVGIVALVSSISSWISGSDDAAERQEALAEAADRVTESIKNQLTERRKQRDFEVELSKAETKSQKSLLVFNKQLEERRKETEQWNDLLAQQVGNYKRIGLSEKEISESDFIKNLKAKVDLNENLEISLEAQIRGLQNVMKLQKESDADAKNKSDKRRARRKKETEQLFDLEQELALMRIADEDERAAAKIEQDRQNDLAEIKRAGNKKEQILLINEKYDQLEAERQQKVDDEAWDLFIENNDKFNEERIADAEKQAEIDQKAAEDKIALDKAVFDARRDMQANAFSAGAALFEKNKKISKAIAVSQTIFSTQQAIVDALAAKGTDALLPYPIRLTNAISAGVIGAASVRNILSENMGDVSAGGGGGTTEPMTPSTTGAFTLGGALPDQEPIKTFVVTDEMSDSQAQLADIRRRSTI